jgi:hypothetical protein
MYEHGVACGSERSPHPPSPLTPSHAKMRNESCPRPGVRTVSLVYGLPRTHSFMGMSPIARVTARIPLTRLFTTNPPPSMMRRVSWASVPLWS